MLKNMMDIDSIHIILLLILVASNLYYYSLFINRNIDYNDEAQITMTQKTISTINLFVGMFLVGVVIVKLIQQKLKTKNGKLLATIIVSILGLIPVVMYLIQIVDSFQNKNDAYNLLVRCRNLIG
jgi:formate-dependent nitrite reductase membrane component NrfD